MILGELQGPNALILVVKCMGVWLEISGEIFEFHLMNKHNSINSKRDKHNYDDRHCEIFVLVMLNIMVWNNLIKFCHAQVLGYVLLKNLNTMLT